MLKRLHSLLPLILAFVVTFLTACGAPEAKIPPTYTPEKIAQLQQYAGPVTTARQRMPELAALIARKNWIDVENFIHGPLGQVRGSMGFISRNLLPKDQDTAKEAAKELFVHLEKIDTAAKANRVDIAGQQYIEALKDFDAFLDLVPNA
ncbi:MAG: photosystem II protein PsbQ [Jaaginema sp. PMC 1079.18]|nr:photosystem II protein PsbQ [Jaaginema sp. PMC 1080.18]MEC4849383.1 photosystem II protein PsbQ [Jaaginema sp. PMC 1079.18]MEC4865416.1 photosystem II protein PsbQ [Jaaginema sp. PMC 1078.18]